MKDLETLQEELRDIIENLDDGDKFTLYNEYCESVNYYDDIVYCMSEIDDILGHLTASEILEIVNGNFNVCDEYFTFDGYGCLESFNYIDDKLDNYIDEIIDDCIEGDRDYYIDEIREFLDDNDDAIPAL